jgi:cytoskeleton protein RodZ
MNEPARVISSEGVQTEVPTAQAKPGAGPGTLLGEERRRQGLSLGDIARQLKLSVRQIEALERDDYGMFAGMVFVRGFLRNYAKLLQLDLEAAIAQLHGGTTPGEVAPVVELAASSGSEAPRAARIPLGWLAGVGVFALLVLAAVYESRQHAGPPRPAPVPGSLSNPHLDSPPAGLTAPQASTAAAPVASADVALSATAAAAPSPAADLPAPAEVAGTPASSSEGASSDPALQAGSPIPTAPPPTPAPAATAAAPAPAAAATVSPTPGPAPARIPALGSKAETGQLRLKFQAEAWVEVKDASGAVVFSRLGSPGTEESVQGRAPLQVVVGNAHAVQLTYQGRIVDLAPHTRVDVARLVLE